MTIETRYFRDDEKLGIVQTGVGDSRSVAVTLQTQYGIMVYNGAICISGPIPVALASVPPFPPREVDGTWVCPNQASAGIIKVEVYACTSLGTLPLLIETFVSTDSIKLDAAMWTVHYFGFEDVEVMPPLIWFYYGKSTQPARITNFRWSIPIVIVKAAVSNPIIFLGPLSMLLYLMKRKRRKRCIVASVI